MDRAEAVADIRERLSGLEFLAVTGDHADEVCVRVAPQFFRETCLLLHASLKSPVMMLFATDERSRRGVFALRAVFAHVRMRCWVIVAMDIPQEKASFDSLSRSVHSAALFEREIREMFGIEPVGGLDLRRLNLHDEVWPQGNYPLRKDFSSMQGRASGEYLFGRVEGEGVFEVPVGPVHAGIIGPGHFRFSVAGEPIIQLEPRLGFTHRGIEKLFEGRSCAEAVGLAERVSGDACIAHSLAFTHAAEKIAGAAPSRNAAYQRAIFLELERMYNHVNDIGGMAVDVGFSFPAALASVIKESVLQLNEKISGSRYLKQVNVVGGVATALDEGRKTLVAGALRGIIADFGELVRILEGSVSFMDRVDTTGVLMRKTAEDLGVVGLAARASGIPSDVRKIFPGVWQEAKFAMATAQSGDCLARLRVRVAEFEESARLIGVFLGKIGVEGEARARCDARAGEALGYAEGWRGPVLYWLKTDAGGLIERCKIVDPSFHNWQGLSYAVLGNIIPDFPLCNKSFDLSYAGNDL